MRIGPVEIEDWSPDYWKVSLYIGGLHYDHTWYAKEFGGHRDVRDILRLYISRLKEDPWIRKQNSALLRSGRVRTGTATIVREIEVAILFYDAMREE